MANSGNLSDAGVLTYLIDQSHHQPNMSDYIPDTSEITSNLSSQSTAEICFVCKERRATPSHPLIVDMFGKVGRTGAITLTFKHVEIAVPICEPCRALENSIEQRRNRVAACLFIPLLTAIVFGAIRGDVFQLGLLGLGVGFFLSLFVRTSVGYRRPSREHPEIKRLVAKGWGFDRPGSQ